MSRGTSLSSLRQALRGDLETIVAKALKKSPGERYATVQELRDDLQRHLDHQPVSAQPDTFGYRARKFAQRNRVQVVALAGVMLSLVLGIAATAWQWRSAAQETDRTKAVIKVLTHIFTELASQVATDLQRKGYASRTIGIKLRFEDFKTVTRDLTLADPVSDAAAVRHAAGLCLKRVDLTRRLRLLGVRASALVRL